MKNTFVLAAFAALACLEQGLQAQAAADDMLELRQIVIRAPELEVAELMADPVSKSGEAVYTKLCEAVQAGRASVVADIMTAADQLIMEARQGRHVWLVTERDQDFDRLYLPPIGFEEVFVGTSLEARLTPADGADGIAGISASWQAACSPSEPAMTRWPTSWLNLHTRDGKPDPKRRLIRGWLDNQDVFTETMVGEHWFAGGQMQLLGVAPPGDQTWPRSRRPGRWLDVFMAQIKPHPDGRPFLKPAVRNGRMVMPMRRDMPADPFIAPEKTAPNSPSPHPEPANAAAEDAGNGPFGDARITLYGIGLSASEAVLVMANRDPARDEALLTQLLARVKRNDARLHVCVGMTGQRATRGTLTAARQHQYPTEMPSIPSAWAARPVGTILETDDRTFSLQHDLAPPRRTEWRLALDDPKAVMWEPRFRSLKITTTCPKSQGTQLVGLQRIPDVMEGNGIPHNETNLLFARREDEARERAVPDQFQPVEAELLVLEVPDAEPADFEKPPEDPFANDDEALFQRLLDRLKKGEVSVAAHVGVATLSEQRNMLRTAEEFMHATEFDPPRGGVPRMRPTALEVEHAGDLLEVELAVPDPTKPTVTARLSFTHTTSIPVEASLETALAYAAKDESMKDYPAPNHPRENWTPAELSVESGKVICLGARKPPGIHRKVVHVAYLKVRRLP